jgi:hypothetical protein
MADPVVNPPAADPRLRRFRPLRDLTPFALAGAILYYVLAGRDWDQIGQAIASCRLPLFLAGAGLFTLGHFLVNAASLKLVFDWFLARVRWTEMIKVYGASLLPQVVINSLGQLVVYLYFIRRYRLPVLPVLGASLLIILSDFWVMAIVLTAALLIQPDPEPVVYVWYGLLLPGLLIATWYFPGRGGERRLPFFYRFPLARILREARPRHYLRFIPVRLCFPVLQMAGHLLALRAMGIEAPLGAVIVIVTAMTFTTFLPVSALGFGAPNFVALYLAPYVHGPAAAEDVAIAYGLLFQTVFLLGRCLIGLGFALPFWREVIKAPEAGLPPIPPANLDI